MLRSCETNSSLLLNEQKHKEHRNLEPGALLDSSPLLLKSEIKVKVHSKFFRKINLLVFTGIFESVCVRFDEKLRNDTHVSVAFTSMFIVYMSKNGLRIIVPYQHIYEHTSVWVSKIESLTLHF